MKKCVRYIIEVESAHVKEIWNIHTHGRNGTNSKLLELKKKMQVEERVGRDLAGATSALLQNI